MRGEGEGRGGKGRGGGLWLFRLAIYNLVWNLLLQPTTDSQECKDAETTVLQRVNIYD